MNLKAKTEAELSLARKRKKAKEKALTDYFESLRDYPVTKKKRFTKEHLRKLYKFNNR